ncbi:unnamed protein product [Boreogadus saida]
MGSMLLAVDPSKSSKKMRTNPNPFRRLRHPAISPPSPRIKCPIGGEPRSVRAEGPEEGVVIGFQHKYFKVEFSN